MPSARPVSPALVLGVFFVSGIAALLYQIVWLKYLGLVFGNTVYAAATLIAVFLAGLGIGGYLFGKHLKTKPPLLIYAGLEAVIGTIGAFSPNGFALLDDGYIASFRAFEAAPLALAIARAFFASLFLLPPTLLMGGTLPVLVRWYSGDLGRSGRPVSSLYAANTFGASAGVALAGFILIPRVGLLTTVFIAVAMNYVLALIAALAAFATRVPPPASRVPRSAFRIPAPDAARLVAPILIASFLMGFTSIADEVFWSRILVLHLGSSVYAYSLMLFSFLIGIAIGSAVIYAVIDRVDLVVTLGVLEVALAVLLSLQIHYFTRFADALEWFAVALQARTYTDTLFASVGATLSALLLPTVIMGATFPIAVKLYGDQARRGESASVGVIYMVNTLGSISGSLLAGFALIRWVGSQNGLFLMALLNLVVGTYFLWPRAGDPSLRFASLRMTGISLAAGLVLVISFATARPDQVILSAGLFVDEKAPVLLFREDVTATVTLRQLGPDYLSLELNGVNVAGTSPDLIGTQKLQGHLPLLMHPNARKVLHIGFGSGGTAHAVSTHPVEEIRIAEISPEVLEASDQHLRYVNHGVLEDRRVKIEINDGRNFVLATPETFDVILSDSIHPRYAGNSSLYTLDYFELCRERLRPGGVISMWLPTYSLTPRNYLMILRAFREVFPNTTVWYVPNSLNAFTIVIGRTEAGTIPLQRMQNGVTATVLAELSDIGIRSAYDLTSALLLDPDGVKELTRGVEAHVDDLPAVEYESGRILDREGSWLTNFAMLSRHMTPLARAFSGVREPAQLARAEQIRSERAIQHITQLLAALQQRRPAAKI